MSDLVWRKEPPNEEGWWWLKEGASRQIVNLQRRKKGITHYFSIFYDEYIPIIEITGSPLWAGPIPEPTEPQGAKND